MTEAEPRPWDMRHGLGLSHCVNCGVGIKYYYDLGGVWLHVDSKSPNCRKKE